MFEKSEGRNAGCDGAGCRGDLPLSELVELLAVAHDRPVDALVSGALDPVRELVRHGLLVPADGWDTA